MKNRKWRLLVFLFALFVLCASFALAEYPFRRVTMIVPYGAGGTTDVVGRQFAAALGRALDTSFVVENQGGASGAIGCQAALDAKRDGSVVLFMADSLGTQRVMDISQMSYNDFDPILVVANDPKVLVVAGDSPYATIDDLLSEIAAKPGLVQMSYTGPGGSGHVQALIMNQYGYFPAMTPYGSGADCYRAVLSGEVVFTNSNYATVASLIESGDLRLLAVAAAERMAAFPDVPALSEKMENSEALLSIPYTPLSLLVAKGVPQGVQDALREGALLAVRDPEFTAFMEDNSIDKLYEKYTTLEEIRSFYDEWESVVSYLIWDAGAAAINPETFGIPRVR